MRPPESVFTPDQDSTVPGLVAHVARVGTERQRARDLLLWSGDGGAEAEEIFVLVDPSAELGEGLGAAVLLVGSRPVEMELRRLAVAEGLPGAPTGRRLIEEVGNVLRARGIRRLHTTPTAVPDPLAALLTELGFRGSHPQGHLTLEL